MVKLDYDRNYYADLELSGTEDAVEVKKQFKKLALKWHPDRNPGKEDEAKERFLVIQAAHEILTDPTTKAKFDAYRQRTTSRYPSASGVRGNPWQYTAQEVNQKFGAPPKRPPMPPRPAAPAGSTRYWDWAQKAKGKTENARANMEAWDRSRPQPKPSQPSAPTAASAARPGTRPSPPQVPPRTAAQARRQEAAFGTRKTGFAPTSPIGDEPPVRNQHYNTGTRESAPQASKPRPASTFVDPLSSQFNETFFDNRQSTPYAANVGEKTNPFEPLNVNRAKSMRDGGRRFQGGPAEAPPQPPSRQRSASVGSDNFQKSANDSPVFNEPNAKPTFQYQSRASARYSPRGAEPNSAPPTATFGGPNSSSSSVNSSANATVNGDASTQARNGTKVYESSAFHTIYHNLYRTAFPGPSSQTPHSNSRAGERVPPEQKHRFSAYMPEGRISAPSGERPSPGSNALEGRLHAQLQHLLSGARTHPYRPHVSSAPNSALSPKMTGYRVSKHTTNTSHAASFSVPDDPATPAQQARFTRNSADNINTRFVAEEKGDPNFRFSAGAPPSPEDGFMRAKQRARGHQSPLRNEFMSSAESFPGVPQQNGTSKHPGDFVADEWKEAFGPHVFEPPQPGRPSASPTRPIRPIKKTRPVRMTAGTAGIVDDDETSGEERPKSGVAPGGIDGSRSPNAMDIDPPAPGPTVPPLTGPRNINVEPTKPEWRAGSGVHAEPKLGAGLKMPGLNPTAAGSEDSDDFLRPMFSEFRNVEPFAQKASGLNSFADLSSNLPFASRPSSKIPLPHEKPKQLEIPTPPTAPRPPAGLIIPGTKLSAPAWTSYVREFEAYLGLWFDFNKKVTDHFAARQKVNEKRGLAWLNAQGDGGVTEYMRSLEEDKFVRQKWMAACEAHELHFREFLTGRERVVRQ